MYIHVLELTVTINMYTIGFPEPKGCTQMRRVIMQYRYY